MRRDNKIVVDINKAQWGKMFYRNQHGQISDLKPDGVTVRGEYYAANELAHHHPEHLGETALGRALRLGITDVWTPVFRLKLSANEFLEYTGPKAISLREAWNAKVFGKKTLNAKKY